jgi:4-hydroxy-tetrahydrodipicolinate synthase
VWCATLTPLDAHGNVDAARFVGHVRRLLAEGIDGVVPFGTTGEGPSFGVVERAAGLDALLAAGIPATRIIAATGCAAASDAIALTRHAVAAGCAGALVAPPFFFKEIGDDGVYASYAALIDGVADPRLRLYLYHIPQVTAVPIPESVVARLRAAYPGLVAGLKDSAGDLAHSLAMQAAFADLAVFVGHEPHLPRLLAAGGAGTICGAANVFPRAMRRLFDAAGTTDEAAALEAIVSFLDIAFGYPLVPAFKAVLAELTADAAWRTVRPPLVAPAAPESAALIGRLRTSRII